MWSHERRCEKDDIFLFWRFGTKHIVSFTTNVLALPKNGDSQPPTSYDLSLSGKARSI